MRIRQIKPDYWEDEDLAEVSRDARHLFIGLWNMADLEGKIKGTARLVRGQLFRYDDDVTSAMVDGWLDQLASHRKKFIVRYEVDGEQYILIRRFAEHQRPDPREKPKGYPDPPKTGKAETLSEQIANNDQDPEEQCSVNVETVTNRHGYMGNGSMDTGVMESGDAGVSACAPTLPLSLPPEFEKSVSLARECAKTSANNQNAVWCPSYLTPFFDPDRVKFKHLGEDSVFDCWQRACLKWDKGPRYVQTVFERELSEWTPEKRALKQDRSPPRRGGTQIDASLPASARVERTGNIL